MIDIYKTRGIPGCIKIATLFFCKNLKLTIKRLWLPTLILAIIGATLTGYGLQDSLTLATQLSTSPDPVATYQGIVLRLIGLLLAYIVAFTVFAAAVFKFLNDLPLKRNIMREAILIGLRILLILTFGLIAYYTRRWLPYSMLALVLLAYIIYVPFHHLEAGYMMQAVPPTHKPLAIFLQGFRRWGFLFAVQLVTWLILGVILLVVGFPTFILAMAKGYSSFGVLFFGDPSGLPASFPWLWAVALLLFWVAICIAFVWAYTVFAYTYGSLNAKRNEKTT